MKHPSEMTFQRDVSHKRKALLETISRSGWHFQFHGMTSQSRLRDFKFINYIIFPLILQQGRPGCTEEASHEILDKYVELGGNFIDTADLYQCGKSEKIIGSWLKKYVFWRI